MRALVSDPALPFKQRKSRFKRVMKQMMTDMNFIGLSDDCVFSKLGYFRYRFAALDIRMFSCICNVVP